MGDSQTGIGADFDVGTDLYWQHLQEAEANKGGNWADASEDALVAKAIACLCRGKPPKRGSGTWRDMTNILKPIHADWGLHDMEVDEALEVVEKAVQRFQAEKPTMAVYKYSSFPADYGGYLSEAIGRADKAETRYARTVALAKESQAAFKERKAARPPPVEDDKWGTAIKGELQLQMTRATFETWIKPAAMVCEDGVFVVTAPDARARDWLEDRLATTIERTAVGVLGRAVEVRFEVGNDRRP